MEASQPQEESVAGVPAFEHVGGELKTKRRVADNGSTPHGNAEFYRRREKGHDYLEIRHLDTPIHALEGGNLHVARGIVGS